MAEENNYDIKMKPESEIKKEFTDEENLFEDTFDALEEINVKIEINEESENLSEISLNPLEEKNKEYSHKENKKQNCEICGKIFKTYGYLKKHIKKVHEGYECKCTTCNKIFTKEIYLKSHIENFHVANLTMKQMKCDFCDKYISESLFNNHVNNCRINDINLQIFHEIGAAFANDSEKNLKSDINIESVHEGQKDFKCNTCVKTFTRKSDLKKHINRTHESKLPYLQEYTKPKIENQEEKISFNSQKNFNCVIRSFHSIFRR